MSPWWWVVVGLVVAGFVGLVVAWRPLRKWGGAIQAERAKELFLLQRERLQDTFRPAAAATGKPRGLRWVRCTFEGDIAFARERWTRQLFAFVPVTIQFEAVEGSDMEGLEAVSNLRNASAVFFFDRGEWRTAGKALFNMNPDEALHHFRGQYELVSSGHH